jgi:hypothetical protein
VSATSVGKTRQGAAQGKSEKQSWACPGLVDRLTLSVLFFSHDEDEALW